MTSVVFHQEHPCSFFFSLTWPIIGTSPGTCGERRFLHASLHQPSGAYGADDSESTWRCAPQTVWLCDDRLSVEKKKRDLYRLSFRANQNTPHQHHERNGVCCMRDGSGGGGGGGVSIQEGCWVVRKGGGGEGRVQLSATTSVNITGAHWTFLLQVLGVTPCTVPVHRAQAALQHAADLPNQR